MTKIKGQEIVFLDPPDQRALGTTDMPPPSSKKELQWFPNVTFSNQCLNAGTAQSSTFIWTIQMQQEYETIKKIFRDQIRLSPFNPKKKHKYLNGWSIK